MELMDITLDVQLKLVTIWDGTGSANIMDVFLKANKCIGLCNQQKTRNVDHNKLV